jgi:hypothetical protein
MKSFLKNKQACLLSLFTLGPDFFIHLVISPKACSVLLISVGRAQFDPGMKLFSAKAYISSMSNKVDVKIAHLMGPKTDPLTVPRRRS